MGFEFGFPFWPEYPDEDRSYVYALHAQLMFSQWLEPGRFLKYQMWQLENLLRVARNARFYDTHLKFMETLPARGLYEQHLEFIPVLNWTRVRNNEKDFVVRKPLPNHGPPRTFRVSKGEGASIRMMETGLIGAWRDALDMRLVEWHDLDVTLVGLDIVEPGKKPAGPIGQRTILPWSGPRHTLSTQQPFDQLFEAFDQIQPGYLRTVPRILKAFIERTGSGGPQPQNLRQVCCRAGRLEPGLRERVEETWGVPVIHELFVPEIGVIAQQCPVSRDFHIHSEYVYAEILDGHGNRCKEGQAGRLITTPLHNFQMPLVRYDTGIRAEPGEACECGRSLPRIFLHPE